MAEISEENTDMFKGLGLGDDFLNELEKKIEEIPADKPEEVADETEEEAAAEVSETENLNEDGTEKTTEQEEEIEEEEIDKAEEEEEAEEEINNPFVTKAKPAAVNPKDLDSVKIENIGAVSTLFKQAGIEVKEVSDLAAVAQELKESRVAIQTAETEATGLRDFKTLFDNLPPDLFKIINSWVRDEDYREVMQTQSGVMVDFNKEFDGNDIKNVMKHYYPDSKFSEEDYEEVDDDPKMQSLIRQAQKSFKADKASLENTRADYNKTREASAELYTESFNKTIAALKKDQFVNEDIEKSVSDVLSNGVSGLLNLFVDKKGNLIADAAKKVSLVLFGEAAIEYHSKRNSKKAVSKAIEDKVLVAADGKKPKGRAVSEGQLQKDVADEIARLIPKQQEQRF